MKVFADTSVWSPTWENEASAGSDRLTHPAEIDRAEEGRLARGRPRRGLLSGHLHAGHWLIDLPGVFVPAILLLVLLLPRYAATPKTNGVATPTPVGETANRR